MISEHLCDVEELKRRLHSTNLIVVDASWFMPAANVDCLAEFERERISSAVFFDIDQVCDQQSDLPHMLPSSHQFAHALTALGITNDADVVIYDTAGLFSAARVWWMFKVFGHGFSNAGRVRVLDGGYPAWKQAGGEVEQGKISVPEAAALAYKATKNETFLVNKDVLKQNSHTGEYLVLDARSKGRFTGEQAEPRAGLKSGHMPRSQSLPFQTLMSEGRLKSRPELLSIFAQFGLDPETDEQPIITSCGSGVTAAIITLALSEAGFALHRLYDGAWAEWAAGADTVILSGHY